MRRRKHQRFRRIAVAHGLFRDRAVSVIFIRNGHAVFVDFPQRPSRKIIIRVFLGAFGIFSACCRYGAFPHDRTGKASDRHGGIHRHRAAGRQQSIRGNDVAAVRQLPASRLLSRRGNRLDRQDKAAIEHRDDIVHRDIRIKIVP